MRYVCIALFLVMVGCATPSQLRANRINNVHGPECEALGYEKNTDGWRGCVLQLEATLVQRYGAAMGASQTFNNIKNAGK